MFSISKLQLNYRNTYTEILFEILYSILKYKVISRCECKMVVVIFGDGICNLVLKELVNTMVDESVALRKIDYREST